MSPISLSIQNSTGRIILQRPEAHNALSYEMCSQIYTALIEWQKDERVSQIIIDAEGEKAFCSGGDITKLYNSGCEGNYEYGHRFWSDEYRLNALIANYPKPYIAFMHGFVMGGGVGISCHGSHRIVGQTIKLAMPECSIGLVPDVGGSALLARAPGQLGAFLGLTGMRMNARDALYAGFADYFVDQAKWPRLKQTLIESGTPKAITKFVGCPECPDQLANWRQDIDTLFANANLSDLGDASLDHLPFATQLKKALSYNSPLAMQCLLEILQRLETNNSVEAALEQEYRYTYRSMEHGDFLEGIRAAIIDKDRRPQWRYKRLADINAEIVDFMLAPLPA